MTHCGQCTNMDSNCCEGGTAGMNCTFFHCGTGDPANPSCPPLYTYAGWPGC
jgi:hypothetical protein